MLPRMIAGRPSERSTATPNGADVSPEIPAMASPHRNEPTITTSAHAPGASTLPDGFVIRRLSLRSPQVPAASGRILGASDDRIGGPTRPEATTGIGDDG